MLCCCGLTYKLSEPINVEICRKHFVKNLAYEETLSWIFLLFAIPKIAQYGKQSRMKCELFVQMAGSGGRTSQWAQVGHATTLFNCHPGSYTCWVDHSPIQFIMVNKSHWCSTNITAGIGAGKLACTNCYWRWYWGSETMDMCYTK